VDDLLVYMFGDLKAARDDTLASLVKACDELSFYACPRRSINVAPKATINYKSPLEPLQFMT